MWYLILTLLVIILLLVVVVALIKDRRRAKQKIVESIGDDLWKEIDRERQMSVEKGKMFRKTLNEAKKRERNN
jgi:uncharacterized membrane protein